MLLKRKFSILVAVLTATFSNFVSAGSELDLVLINEGSAQNLTPQKILSRLPNEVIGDSLDYSISLNPFEDSLVLAYDINRRAKSIGLFSKAYMFSMNGLKKDLSQSHPNSRITFEEPNVSYVLNRAKPGELIRYEGLTQYFVPSSLKDKAIGSLSAYSVIYQYDTYLRLAYDYLLNNYPSKATRDYSSLLAAFYVMKNEGIDAFYPMYRYEIANFFSTDQNSFAQSAWMIKVAASYFNQLDDKGVMSMLNKSKIKSQLHESLLSVSIPSFEYLEQSFSLDVYQNGFYEYYDLISTGLVSQYSNLYDTRNCLSLMPQVPKDSVLYMIEDITSIDQVCNLSKQINKGKIDESIIKQISKDHSMKYIRKGRVDPKVSGSYGAMLLSDLSYVVDISRIGR